MKKELEIIAQALGIKPETLVRKINDALRPEELTLSIATPADVARVLPKASGLTSAKIGAILTGESEESLESRPAWVRNTADESDWAGLILKYEDTLVASALIERLALKATGVKRKDLMSVVEQKREFVIKNAEGIEKMREIASEVEEGEEVLADTVLAPVLNSELKKRGLITSLVSQDRDSMCLKVKAIKKNSVYVNEE